MALTDFKSQLIADIGISMGDEGKGRLIYEVIEELAAKTGREEVASVVMKVNGGANSGHTAGGIKLNLLPAGVIAPKVRHLAIGSGVVADPRKFLWEALPLEKAGYKILSRLVIDERTMVSDLGHRLLDLAYEDYRVNVLGEEPRGSTGRGVTPAYMDEVGQFQIFYADYLLPREAFAKKLSAKLRRACDTIKNVCKVSAETWDSFFETLTNAELRANAEAIESGVFGAEEFDFYRFKGASAFELNTDAVIECYWRAGRELAECVGDVREICHAALSAGEYIIGEFGQAYWLDKRHGFTPNVTASHTGVPEIFQSAGLPVQPVHTLGCCKAYDTKVGTHLFLTAMDDSALLTQKLKKLEFGTSTGRQRMVGWFDAVEKGDALRYGGYDDIVINKLDALTCDGELEGAELLLCTHYEDPSTGEKYFGVPRNDGVRKKLKPAYLRLPSWKQDISGVRSFSELPQEAADYVALCMKSVLDVAQRNGCALKNLPNLRYIGVGPLPSQIIRDVPPTDELLCLARAAFQA